MNAIQEIWDGDTYPVIEFELKSETGPRNTTDLAVWFDIKKDGVFLARRPGTLASPKSSGIVEYFLRGAETDWGGSGANLTIYPYVLVPVAMDGGSANSILTNPSFDTFGGTTPTQLATSWTVAGTQTGSVYTVANTGSKPPAISGNYQSIVRPTVSGFDQFRQVNTGQSGVAGDHVTFGVWVRGESITGTQNNQNAIRLIFSDNSVDNVTTQMPVGSFDWTFLTVSRKISSAQTSIDSRIVTHGNSGTWQFDEACTFFGSYIRLDIEPRRIKVLPRMRVPRTSNQLQGIGGFERDSNGDGLPDGWMHGATFTPTLSLEKDPLHVSEGTRSLKAVCTGGAGFLKVARRGRWLAGEVYRAKVKAKTSGTLTGTAPSFQMNTGAFDSGQVFGTTGTMGQTLATFTEHTADVTLTADCSLLELQIDLGGVTGTLWLDDIQVFKV